MMSTSLEVKLQKNILKLNIYSFFQMFLVIIPIIVPFWQAKGLTLQQIFSLQAIFGFAMIAFDLPAGYLADVLGRKKVMIIGSIITALGFQILWFGQSYFHFVIYEFVLGLGLSLQSGCDVAILYNTLEKLNHKSGRAQYLGWRVTSQTLGEAVASLLAGGLVLISLNLPAYVNAVTAWVPVFVAMWVVEPPGQTLSRRSHFENMKTIVISLFAKSKFLSFAIINNIFYGFATYCAVWSLQPLWKELGIGTEYFGLLWAINNFAVAFVSQFTHKIEKRLGSIVVIVTIAIMPVVGYFGMGYVTGLSALLFTLAFPVCRGLNQVLFQDAINSRVPAEIRATANSVGSLGMRALFIAFGPLLGRLLDQGSVAAAMRFMGLVYLVGFFVVALPLLTQRREFRLN